LLLTYFGQLRTGATVSDVVPLLSDEDRAEYLRLREALSPDGYVLASTDELFGDTDRLGEGHVWSDRLSPRPGDGFRFVMEPADGSGRAVPQRLLRVDG
jgi:hypothetical protein